MSPRKSLSAKTRFEVFKRDGFVCTYCGSHPPNAVLHVDHIVAVAKGGANDEDNLTTACDRCNLGKGARDLNVAPMSLPEKAALVREKEAQLRGYTEVMEDRRIRLDNDAWHVISIFDEKVKTFPRDWILSIKKFIDHLGVSEVLDAMEIARAKRPHSDNQRFRYFCGICWNKVRAAEGQI